VAARCLPAIPSRTGNDYSWVGAGIRLDIEQNDWLGHAVTSEVSRLILEEVLGFNVSITQTPMAFTDPTNNPLSRIANGTIDANFEAWKVDYGTYLREYTQSDGPVTRSTYELFEVCCAHDKGTRVDT
jgi:hypothetical protein